VRGGFILPVILFCIKENEMKGGNEKKHGK